MLNINNNININSIINLPILKSVDLFAGTGSFSYCLEKTNKVKCVFSNDIEESSKQMYDLNCNTKLTLMDMNNIDIKTIPNHNILSGGFSCQPFSIAGKQEGLNDIRSNALFKLIEIIEFHKPECIILENVKNLVSHDKGNTFKSIINKLTDIGYYLKYKVLDTSVITNIPQHRERIYIIGLRNKEKYNKFSLEFPSIINKKIKELLEQNIDTKYYYTNKSSTWELLKKSVIKKDTIYQYRRVYVRENKNNKCPTLTANMGTGGHNVPIILDDIGIRKLTPRECFNFQGFPLDYKLPNISDSKLYKLAGNAVSIPVIEIIIKKLLEIL